MIEVPEISEVFAKQPEQLLDLENEDTVEVFYSFLG
jgi:hypothetical protein